MYGEQQWRVYLSLLQNSDFDMDGRSANNCQLQLPEGGLLALSYVSGKFLPNEAKYNNAMKADSGKRLSNWRNASFHTKCWQSKACDWLLLNFINMLSSGFSFIT